MPDFFYTFFWFLLGLFVLQFLLSMILAARMSNKIDGQAPKITGVSVVIPFHNEADRIGPLLESLNRQRFSNDRIEFIFVDDHSGDDTQKILQEKLRIPYQRIHAGKKSGKKAALHEGIEQARYQFILTLDADVELPENYLDYLFQLPESDMVILPVKMDGLRPLQKLAAVEFDWLQLLTFGSPTPVLCNGANLFFRKAAYQQVYQTRTDFDLASGDDVFLLGAFLKHKYRILRIHDDGLTVKTPAPASPAALFRQRRRWIGKMSRMGDAGSYLALIFLVVIELAFIFSAVAVFYNPIYLFLVALKFITELLIAFNAARSNLASAFIITLIHQVWYPLYLIVLFFPGKRDERWGR